MTTTPQELLKSENYTAEAWDLVQAAPLTAAKFKRAVVDALDLFVVGLDLENNLYRRVCDSLGADFGTFKNAVLVMIGQLPATGSAGQVTMSADLLASLARSNETAEQHSEPRVTNDCILLGISKQLLDDAQTPRPGSFADLVRRTGISLDMLEKELWTPSSQPTQRSKVDIELLEQYGEDLTDKARLGKLDPVVGRDAEIEMLMRVLTRRTKNNAALIGDAGVGKTAIVEGLAQRIATDDAPTVLKNRRLITLQMGALVAGTSLRGQFEERLQKVLLAVREAQGEILLFIDELHQVVGAGAVGGGGMDAANIMKPALAKGELQVMGATTPNEYRRYIEQDDALARRFSPVWVEQPSPANALEMLRILKPRYEKHHGKRIEDAALKAAVKLSARYISDRFLPDKAVDLIDEAAAKLRIQLEGMPDTLRRREAAVNQLVDEEQAANEKQEYEAAAKLKVRRLQAVEQFETHSAKWCRERLGRSSDSVTPNDIAAVIAERTGIPVKRLAEGDRERLLQLEERLHKRVIGQDAAISALANSIRRARAGLKDAHRPMGSFMFLGPTGVGKTESARALAEFLFDDENNMVRIDMSEYKEAHSISRLIGSPPGYVGYDSAGQLTEKIRRRPFSVVLFDEVEKAHRDVFDTLLQVLDDGRLTDNHGRTVDFSNTVVVLTSNVGTAEVGRPGIGFKNGDGKIKDTELRAVMLDELRRQFKPEFINRLDEIIVFQPLNEDEVLQIVDKMLNNTIANMAEQGIKLEVTAKARRWLAQAGYDREYGARPLRREIQRRLENELAKLVIGGNPPSGVVVDADRTKLRFKLAKNKSKP